MATLELENLCIICFSEIQSVLQHHMNIFATLNQHVFCNTELTCIFFLQKNVVNLNILPLPLYSVFVAAQNTLHTNFNWYPW